MLINFFHGLRDAGVPVTTRELLDLIEGLKQRVVFGSMDEFYYFSRTCMVKDEKYFDRFDKAFGLHFKDLEALDDVIEALIPDEILKERDPTKAIPPLYGALLKNEQDVHLLERLAFMHRRESR